MKRTIPATVDHPQFEQTMELKPGAIVVCFRVGGYREVPPEVRAAEARIAKALEDLDADIALVRSEKFHGNVVFYRPNAYAVNPEITDAMREAFIGAAQAAYPGWQVTSTWDNQTHGLHGFSVQMQRAEAA